MRENSLAEAVGLAAIMLWSSDTPRAQDVLVTHRPVPGGSADPSRALRSVSAPPAEWKQTDFDDSGWMPFVDFWAGSNRPSPGVPPLWTAEMPDEAGVLASPPEAKKPPAIETPKATFAAGDDRKPLVPQADYLPDRTEAPGARVEAPFQVRRDLAPVVSTEVTGIALRGALAATLPAAPLLASAVFSQRSGRTALQPDEPLLPPCTGGLYVRRKFDLPSPPQPFNKHGTLLLRARFADGFAAFVNGTEVLREQLPEPPPGDLLLLASDRGPSEPERFYLSLASLPLKPKGNLLALEAHSKTPLRCPQLEAELLLLHGPRLLRGPYIERLSDTELDLTVETELPARVLVRVGRGEKPLLRDREIRSGTTPQTVHRLHVSGLRPATLHHYQVALLRPDHEAERTVLPLQTFHTMPQSPMPLRVIVYGDSRSGHPTHAQMIQAILAEEPDLVLHTGDLVERGTQEGGWDRFFSIAAPLLARLPVYVTPGNHDYAVRRLGAQRLFALFETQFAQKAPTLGMPPARATTKNAEPKPSPRGYYSFDAAGVHFVCLDSNQAGRIEQMQWLEQDLTQASAPKNKPRAIFAWMHEGPFSVGWHGDFPTAIKHLVPILLRHRVTLLFSGHDHDYERGQRQGLRYIVTGGGGAELRPLRCDPRRRRCQNQPLFFANEHHYIRLDVLPAKLRACARRLDGTVLEDCQEYPLG